MVSDDCERLSLRSEDNPRLSDHVPELALVTHHVVGHALHIPMAGGSVTSVTRHPTTGNITAKTPVSGCGSRYSVAH